MFDRKALRLLVAVSLMLGLVGPARVLLVPKVQAQDASVQSVAVEGTPTVHTASSGSSASFSHTTGTGTDRLMLVGVSWNSNTVDTSILSVTFTPEGGGDVLPLNEVISRKYASNMRYAAIWYSPTEPPAETTGMVAVTFSASVSSGIVIGAANFAGVDTTTPLGSPNGADAYSDAVSVTLNGLAGDELVFDTVFRGGTSTDLTVGAGQTQLWNSFVSPARGGASTEQATGDSVEMDWTMTTSGMWVSVAVPIYPACTGVRYTLTAGNDGHGTVALTPVGGSYCSGRSVTLTPVPDSGHLFSGWVGEDKGDISGSEPYTIVMDGDKSVTANFAPQSCTDVPLIAEDDTYLSAAAATTNYGNSATLQVDGTTGTSRRTALLRWNLSSIPTNATVSSAAIQLQVTDASTIAYPLYDVIRAWVEGDGTAGSGATWTTYDGTNNWGTAGASTTTGDVDRGITNLWSSTTSSFTPAGSKTISLNADGVAVVQSWVDGATNNGVIIQQYSGTTNNLIFESAESATEANRPRLNINYCLPDDTWPDAAVLVAPAPDGVTGVSTSPTLEVTVSDPDDNALDVRFLGRVMGETTWQDLGTVYAVASGANATMAWPGLAPSTQYEWTVEIYDGYWWGGGPPWSFTTGGGAVCYALTLGHTGNGSDPVATPANSAGCTAGQYVAGENISLSGATPDTGWTIVSWSGTSNDTSTASTNSLVMPASAHSAGVNYNYLCYALTLGHTGNGTTPLASSSAICAAGYYAYGETVNLSGAAADLGWGIASWYGTDNDTSTANTNSLTMPASPRSAGVNYLRLLGDVNLDGAVNSTDALIVLSADAGISTVAFCPMNYGDVNADGYVNSTDALIILSYDVGMSVGSLPVGQPVAEPVLTTQPPGCGA